MTKDELVMIRGFLPEDKNLIFSTILNGLYFGGSVFGNMKKHTFMTKYNTILQDMLNLPTTKIKVACLKESPDVILGYAVFSGDALAYVFCKKEWRNIGLAKDLVGEAKVFTHYTKVGLAIANKKGMEFDPFIL